MTNLQYLKIIMRGAGDLATGVALRLHRCGFNNLLLLETEHPLAVRRRVSFSEAVNSGEVSIEGVTARHIIKIDDAVDCWGKGEIPILVDPQGSSVASMQPDVLIDAIIAKRNLGTRRDDAELVIGLGPGFCATEDVDCAIETMRGHDLGRVLRQGSALADTGIPGAIEGYSHERLLRAPGAGLFETELDIGAMVTAGETVGTVDGKQVIATISGVIRGLLRSATPVQQGTKLGDIDPRGEPAFCNRVSDKAMAVAGGVVEAVLWHYNC